MHLRVRSLVTFIGMVPDKEFFDSIRRSIALKRSVRRYSLTVERERLTTHLESQTFQTLGESYRSYWRAKDQEDLKKNISVSFPSTFSDTKGIHLRNELNVVSSLGIVPCIAKFRDKSSFPLQIKNLILPSYENGMYNEVTLVHHHTYVDTACGLVRTEMFH